MPSDHFTPPRMPCSRASETLPLTSLPFIRRWAEVGNPCRLSPRIRLPLILKKREKDAQSFTQCHPERARTPGTGNFPEFTNARQILRPGSEWFGEMKTDHQAVACFFN